MSQCFYFFFIDAGNDDVLYMQCHLINISMNAFLFILSWLNSVSSG